jgi:hypothetical protein
VLACLVAWVIPGEGEKSSIAENIAGKKHGAWPGWRSPGRFPAHLQAVTGEWIGYTAVAESFLARGLCGAGCCGLDGGEDAEVLAQSGDVQPRPVAGSPAAAHHHRQAGQGELVGGLDVAGRSRRSRCHRPGIRAVPGYRPRGWHCAPAASTGYPTPEHQEGHKRDGDDDQVNRG